MGTMRLRVVLAVVAGAWGCVAPQFHGEGQGEGEGEGPLGCVAVDLQEFCGNARKASVGNCINCVRSHPQLHDCRDALIDSFCAGKAAKPHIVMALADDVGYANVGWNRPSPTPLEVQTPTLDSLVRDGIELTSFYTFKYCAPSRSAFISGRNPIHVSVVNGQTTSVNPEDPVSGFTGIPTEMTSIAEKMTAAGYRAHAVGKWDVGMATFRHTAAGRGFESWLGYFGHCNDYWTQLDRCGMSTCPGDAPGASIEMVDLWQQTDFGQTSGPARLLNNSRVCSQSHQPAHSCTYEDDMFYSRVVTVLNQHATTAPPETPLFLFWSTHACHGPLEVPQATLNQFSFVADTRAQLYAALTHYLDTMVESVVAELQRLHMWDDTIFIFSSDNGGEIDAGSSNWPLRGGKFSSWQGGIHVVAFVSGGWLPASRRGIKADGLATLWDLYATFGSIAGLSPSEATADDPAARAGLPPVDSINQWPYWSGEISVPPRSEIAVGAAIGGPFASHGGGDAFLTTAVEGLIRADGMKLLITQPGQPLEEAIWTGPSFPNSSFPASSGAQILATSVDCAHGCLFNVSADADPTEHHDLSAEMPLIVSQMRARIEELNRTTFSPHRGLPSSAGCYVALQKWGGFWGPFVGIPDVPSPTQLCDSQMEVVCPLSAFADYQGCRQCLKDAIGLDGGVSVSHCKPAAPPKFQRYCCQQFVPTDPRIHCGGLGL